MASNNAYSSLAEKLIEKRLSKEYKLVKIDHLAFSFRLAELRHCHRAGIAGKTAKTQTFYPQPPKVETLVGDDLEHIEKHKLRIEAERSEFYLKTLKIFVDDVLGFDVSAPRDKGFHGYTNSMTMKSKNGQDVGFIGIGGQNDTVYIQISGFGCKHLFDHTTPFVLHHWLNTVFSVSHLSRIDLAKDDYDDNFDCNYAETAYLDGWFRSGKGGQMPTFKNASEYRYDNNMSRIYDVEMVAVGKRTSPIYWRIYNKKLEQGIKDVDLSWFRTEVELKKWSVDALLNPDLAFAGINAFSQSMVNQAGIRTKSMTKAKEAAVDVASRVRWIRRACGKALGDILDFYDGDIEQTFGLILPDDTGNKLGIPPSYKNLINFATGATT